MTTTLTEAVTRLRAEIWEAAEHDTKRIEKAKISIGERHNYASDYDYYARLLLNIQTRKPAKKSGKAKLHTPSHVRDRYAKAYRDFQRRNFPHWATDGHVIEEPNWPDLATKNGLRQFICCYITWQGYRATKINVEGREITTGPDMGDGKHKKRIKSSTRAGTSDVSSTIAGRAVMWEIKINKDRPSAAQLDEQARERAAGGEYFFTRNAEEFFAQYDQLIIS